MQEDYIKLIFGLKIKQIRTAKELSLFKLSKITGLSKSYLNEIEKGKKYPKTDKIVLLAEAFDVPYDELVSLKLDKNLAPVAEILQSNLLKEIPLELFGIEERDLIEIISNAPMKVNAFISTLIEIGNNYNLTRESFFLASLRSFQEANDNYFPEIEQSAKNFFKQYAINQEGELISDELMIEILKEEYGYEIFFEDFKNFSKPELAKLRSIYIEEKKHLYINSETDLDQKRFILAKELGYNYLELKERLYTYTWISFENFDQLLNNFYASYFAGALLLPEDELIAKMNILFSEDKHDLKNFLRLFGSYTESPETVYQRMTNLLPKHFNIKDLFFLRLTTKVGSDNYKLTKELHLNQQQSPQANETEEHYCRRWVSLNVLKQLENAKPEDENHLISSQISIYPYNNNQKYYVISSATRDPFNPEYLRSVTIGLLNKSAQRKVKFLNDPSIPIKEVAVTCENCGMKDCTERVAPPKRFAKDMHSKRLNVLINDFIKEKSQ
ncbi:helix-turn-helix domain-containing protein [Faecalibacter rhinopitheci]|uniref:Helix-turn-helix domain-containing protein n=1 Tax=Faecalibacter rhinopitheci TaxID=2779678 RepID=A0A8J7FPT9_9FLAO|nr:XRE family transcriptional regulator [Faecalibacter rhinopitheci]MBF0597189.1 helix-turn-helix domain-containing protein [Faecalibacter rhinopitheci]MBQ0148184.1 helix-turn-helix domain-containing protein [Candidatus Onthonaster equi]